MRQGHDGTQGVPVTGVGLSALAPRSMLADDVYTSLLQAIFDGRLRAGAHLSVPKLAEMLGVSRTPVREAIQRLAREGLAVAEANKGAVLLEVDTTHLIEVYAVREVLEGLAARSAAESMTDAEVEQLDATLREHQAMLQGDDMSDHVKLDMRFHELVRMGARNSELSVLLDRLQSKIRLAMVSTVVSAGPERAVHDHTAIFSAIADRDPDRAEQLAREHVARLRAHLLRTHTSGHDVPDPHPPNS